MSRPAFATKKDPGISAQIVDLADMSSFEASVRDLSERGCLIVSDKVDLLRDEIGLRLSGVEKLIHGNIVARGENRAQISFRLGSEKPVEKRREPRRPVLITAVVCGRTSSVSMKCLIVDASKSGCRLEGDRLDRLPEEIEISIPSMSTPIVGQIVWRRDDKAGVRLSWAFGEQPGKKAKETVSRAEDQRPRRRKRVTAFGGEEH